MGLTTRFFSDEQMERLRSYPDIGREELIRFFTLTAKDLGFIDNQGRGGGRGPAARLGLAAGSRCCGPSRSQFTHTKEHQIGSQLNLYISYNGNARQAMEFYQEVFGGELEMGTVSDSAHRTRPTPTGSCTPGSTPQTAIR